MHACHAITHTCHAITHAYHATHSPTYANCATVGRHSAFPSTGPGEGTFQDIRILLAIQAISCALLFTLAFAITFALPSPPPPTPLCVPRPFF